MANLRGIRQSKGMTQQQLAEVSGVPRICIARYESGKNSPSIRNADRIAKALNCTISELIGGENHDQLPDHQ